MYTLTKRYLKVTMRFPDGSDVVIDQRLNLRVRIEKNALALQNKAEIEVTGLTQNYRSQLLSMFTAWKKRLVDSGQISATDSDYSYIPISVEAGYYTDRGLKSAVIYKGEIVQVDPASPPPDITIKITAYTRQIDKLKFITDAAPSSTTYANYVKWVAGQMGIGKNYVCDTSFNNEIVKNPARSRYTVAALIWDIQDMYKPSVAAFVDDDFLYVKDQNKILNKSAIAQLTSFVGIPTWNEWGVTFKTLFDPTVRLAQGVTLTSKLNPIIDGTYVTTKVSYELTSREQPFYVSGQASPAAA